MNACTVLLALCSLFLFTDAYPLLSMPQFPAVKYDVKIKRNDEGFPLTDDDVLQLEHLKRTENQNKEQHETITSTSIPAIKSTAEQLPNLEPQLEVAKPNIVEQVSNQKQPQHPMHPVQEQAAHQPGGTETSTPSGDSNAAGPAMAKQYHGAARLAFGQNPEVLPTSSTASTTSTTSTASTTVTTTPELPPVAKDDLLQVKNESEILSVVEAILPAEEPIQTTDMAANANQQIEQVLNEQVKPTAEETVANVPPVNVGETAAFELLDTFKVATRRSASSISSKAAERLLQHRDGQYSAFDMAQYVFWTGDESGVARAVEELIERGMMTRENALKFLREIRLGIDYLEHSYANRVMPADLRQNHIKKTYTMPPRLVVPPSTTTEHVTIATEKPLKAFVPLWRSSKPFDSAATWSKLQELNANEAAAAPNDYDEASGRAKIAEFLYTEYTLEEILYKLAKVMFTQSLAHGSDEAQKELQKLTDFLEREGNLGVIPIDLQKKVLNTLLTALSDTLSEHPELLPAARSNLSMQYNKLDE